MHGRAALSFGKEDLDALRRHIEPGGGTLFARRRLRQPGVRRGVSPVRGRAASRRRAPGADPHATTSCCPPRSASTCPTRQYTKAAGGGKDFPQLEGVKINGHWAIIYSKYDIGCALERHSGLDCKGYTYESALKIAANIVIYSTLP